MLSLNSLTGLLDLSTLVGLLHLSGLLGLLSLLSLLHLRGLLCLLFTGLQSASVDHRLRTCNNAADGRGCQDGGDVLELHLEEGSSGRMVCRDDKNLLGAGEGKNLKNE